MLSSTAVSFLFVGLAIASPLKQVAKKEYVYDVVTDVVTDVVEVTVTDGASVPAATTSPVITVTQATTVAVTTPVQNEAYGFHPLAPGFHRPSSSQVAASSSSSTTSAAPVVTVTVKPTTSSVVAVPTTTAAAATSSVAPSPVDQVAASSSSLDASDATSTDLVTASLYHHNVHRSNHSAPEVSWNTSLASYAATVAASCVYAHNLTPGGGGYGQNIAVFGETGDVQSLGEAHEVAQASTDMWYNGEINSFLPSYYGEANPDFSNFDAWGHFSQMVWKTTEEIGCASQFCDAGTIFSGFGSWFTVCNYGPEGNMGGEYGANVLEPLGQPTVTS